MMRVRPAVFLDKDGTLLHDVPFNVDPERVRLRDGAGAALALLARAGYGLVLVTNHPASRSAGSPPRRSRPCGGVSTGCSHRMRCVSMPSTTARIIPKALSPSTPARAPAASRSPGCCSRPRAMHLDLGRSWMVDDILDDVEAGRRAGCRTVLLDVGSETEWRRGPLRAPDVVCASLPEAAEAILAARPMRGAA